MELNLTGRHALITGGSGLLGSVIATKLASEGARVHIAGRDTARLETAAAAIEAASGIAVAWVQLDTTDDRSVTAAVESAEARFGPIDVLVNCAAPPAHTVSTTDDEPTRVITAFQIKAVGYLRCARAVSASMQERGWGRIINVSGQNAYLTGSVAGSVRNVAVAAISKNLADELAGTGVTVNVVHPAFVGPAGNPELQTATLGVPGSTTPEEVAALTAFLASPLASSISGESIAIGQRALGSIAY